MNFLGMEIVIGIIGAPFVLITSIPAIIAIIYLVYLIIITIKYRAKMGLRDLKTVFLTEENVEIPQYEPAIMGYLVNCQKIGKREICSTLFDLIGRNVIKITLKSGFVSDNKGQYILEKNEADVELKVYEKSLINYLFEGETSIGNDVLNKKLYKKNIDKNFYSKFLREIQRCAKMRNFYDAKTGKKKYNMYKRINSVVTVIAILASSLLTLVGEIDNFDDGGIMLTIIVFSLIAAAILWVLKFSITLMFNLSCYYNDFSDKGSEDYYKWMGFKKYLVNCSSIPNHPLMGVMVWERYYAYAIGLKCSKKFFKQMKKMKIMDNSIDIGVIETFNDIVHCIGVSTKKIKRISIDRYGGSHVDY